MRRHKRNNCCKSKTCQSNPKQLWTRKSIHKNVKSKNILGQDNGRGPHYEFEVGNLELFQRKLEQAEEDKGIQFRYEFMTIENRWMDVILGFLQ